VRLHVSRAGVYRLRFRVTAATILDTLFELWWAARDVIVTPGKR
jgi:hypothetical protein